jgi:RecA-family ATPase
MSETPDYVIQSALEWREQQAKRRAKVEEKPRQQANGHAEPLSTIVAATRAGKAVPASFIDEFTKLLPVRNVILLGGDGGMGKSLLALQLGIACTTGTAWIGIEVAQGPVIYFSAEDELAELDRRMEAICAAEGIELNTSFELHLLNMAGEDAALVTESHKATQLTRTDLFRRLEATTEMLSPMVLILDNLADVYSGNENNRALVKAFIGMLRGLCLHYDCTVLILGHPSAAGRASGSGESGSTAWNNSVRSRLYLHKPDGADEGKDDGARILEVMKANYAVAGQRIELKWKDGRFVRAEHKSPWERIAVADVDRVKERFANGRWRVHEQAVDWGGYAVAEVLDWDVGRGVGAKERSKEQNRNRGHIRGYLAGWVRSKAIYVVNGLDAHRAPTQFYSNREERCDDAGTGEMDAQ